MGNTVGVDKIPIPLSDVYNLTKSIPDDNMSTDPEFSDFLFIWKFEIDKTFEIPTSNAIPFFQLKQFPPESSYLILRIFFPQTEQPPFGDAELGRFSALVQASGESLTPRGVNSVLISNTAETTQNRADALGYQIYVWNGTKSSRLVKASVIAHAYKLSKCIHSQEVLKFLSSYPKMAKAYAHPIHILRKSSFVDNIHERKPLERRSTKWSVLV